MIYPRFAIERAANPRAASIPGRLRDRPRAAGIAPQRTPARLFTSGALRSRPGCSGFG